MPRYEIITSPGFQYPVGAVIETDNLHPSMVQHVRPMDRAPRAEFEEPEGVEDVDSREQDTDKAHAAALKVDKALNAKAKVRPGDSENT